MSRSAHSSHPQALQGLILKYLLSCPDARDTAEGIAQWWLHDEPLAPTAEDVRRTLDSLVKWGWLTETGGRAGRTRYGLNQSRRDALQELFQCQPISP